MICLASHLGNPQGAVVVAYSVTRSVPHCPLLELSPVSCPPPLFPSLHYLENKFANKCAHTHIQTYTHESITSHTRKQHRKHRHTHTHFAYTHALLADKVLLLLPVFPLRLSHRVPLFGQISLSRFSFLHSLDHASVWFALQLVWNFLYCQQYWFPSLSLGVFHCLFQRPVMKPCHLHQSPTVHIHVSSVRRLTTKTRVLWKVVSLRRWKSLHVKPYMN